MGEKNYEYLYTNGKSSYKRLEPEYENVSNPRSSREMKNKEILRRLRIFMFAPCINSIKALFY